MTVLEAIQKSSEFLDKKGVESPRLQSELLLAHLMKMPRMKLYLNFERGLTASETDTLRELIKRRGQREPLQHITGSTSFCGCEIAVNRHVLIPRPETELLAELGWQFLTERRAPSRLEQANVLEQAGTVPGGPMALDLCTGSGCIAIAVAIKCSDTKIVATDISADALVIARENAVMNQVADRIEFLQGDGFTAITGGTRFDLIISNPPYIPSAEIAALEPEVRNFDPKAALDGGPDGLDFYRLITAQAGKFLKSGGKIMVEFGDGHAEAIRTIFKHEKWIVEAVREDYSHRARILIARLD